MITLLHAQVVFHSSVGRARALTPRAAATGFTVSPAASGSFVTSARPPHNPIPQHHAAHSRPRLPFHVSRPLGYTVSMQTRKQLPIALTIAGSDSGGGAGI